MFRLAQITLSAQRAASAGHQPLPLQQAGVSIWDVAPASAGIRQSGAGGAYQFTVEGEERRGIASLRLFDVGEQDVVFLFPGFKNLDNFVVAAQGSRFQCGTQRPEGGVVYACSWKGGALKEERVRLRADGLQVSVPAELFRGGKTVRLEWLDFWR